MARAPQCEPTGEESNLTDDEIEAAINATKDDAVLSELLGDAAHEVGVGSQAWEFRDDITFVTVNFSLAEPLTIDADLPRLDTGSRGGEADPTTIELPPPGYIVETDHYELLTYEISALVYLETGEVMSIFPLPFPLDGLDTGAP